MVRAAAGVGDDSRGAARAHGRGPGGAGLHEDELKRQLRSDRFSRLAELMERATERPKVEFALPSGMRGLEYAEAVREGGKS